MLRPAKHSHPDKTVLYLSTLLAVHLRRRRLETYAQLYSVAKTKVTGAEVLFIPALEVLYALGLIEYRPKADSFEYIGPPQ